MIANERDLEAAKKKVASLKEAIAKLDKDSASNPVAMAAKAKTEVMLKRVEQEVKDYEILKGRIDPD